MLNIKYLAVVVFCFIVIFSAAIIIPVYAVEGQTCTGTSVVYVRGSGQISAAAEDTRGYERERDSLASSLSSKLSPDSYDFSELLDSEGRSYKAVPVTGTARSSLTGIAAALSSGQIGKYKESYEGGVNLLVDELSKEKYTSRCLVLAGYSQGAHVIGDAIQRGLLDNVKSRIIYVGLLGDPKLDLHGYGLFAGREVPWYRGDAVPIIQGGILGSRRPDYLPRLVNTKQTFTDAGSWCYSDDPVCTSNILGGAIDGGHGKYVERAIPQMAQEIANAISKRKPTAVAPQSTCGALKQDIVVAVNVSPSVINDNYFLADSGLKVTSDMLNSTGCDVRTAMVTFGRKGFEPTKPEFDFGGGSVTSTLASYRNAPKSNVVEKADVAGAIDLAMDMSWRPDAQKMVLVLSDAPGDNYVHDFWGFQYDTLMARPEMRQILNESRQKGGIEIHAGRIYHPDNQSFTYTPGATTYYMYMDRLVKATAGTFRDKERCNICSWLDTRYSLKDILAKKPAMAVANIRAKVGETVSLNAKDISAGVLVEATKNSYGVSYGWYVDCAKPEFNTVNDLAVTFKPTATGTCYGALLVRQSSKLSCNICYEGDPYGIRTVIPFTVEVLPANYIPPPAPLPVQSITKERLWQDDAIRVSWDPPANAAAVGELAYIVKDADGSVLGITRSTKLHITDVADDDDAIVTVAAASATSVGEAMSSGMARDISSPRPVEPTEQEAVSETEGSRESEEVLGMVVSITNPPVSSGGATSIVPLVTAQILGSEQAKPATGFVATIMSPIESVLRGGDDKDESSSPWWISLTIIAVPVTVLIALGFVVKYGLLLKFAKR